MKNIKFEIRNLHNNTEYKGIMKAADQYAAADLIRERIKKAGLHVNDVAWRIVAIEKVPQPPIKRTTEIKPEKRPVDNGVYINLRNICGVK